MASKTVNINANVQWESMQSESSKMWIGVCHPLNITVEGETLDELHSMINETMHILFLDLFEDDELHDFLEQHGWTATGLDAPSDGDLVFAMPWTMSVPGGTSGTEYASH